MVFLWVFVHIHACACVRWCFSFRFLFARYAAMRPISAILLLHFHLNCAWFLLEIAAWPIHYGGWFQLCCRPLHKIICVIASLRVADILPIPAHIHTSWPPSTCAWQCIHANIFTVEIENAALNTIEHDMCDFHGTTINHFKIQFSKWSSCADTILFLRSMTLKVNAPFLCLTLSEAASIQRFSSFPFRIYWVS